MRVFLNPKIISAYAGYNHLIDIYHTIKDSSDCNIEISFLKTTWFEANLAAVLGAIIELLNNEGKTVSIVEVNNPNMKDVLRRNGFLLAYGEEAISLRQQTIISYKKFKPNADNEFISYIKNELLSKPDFPKHSILLGKRINENIFELYENVPQLCIVAVFREPRPVYRNQLHTRNTHSKYTTFPAIIDRWC